MEKFWNKAFKVKGSNFGLVFGLEKRAIYVLIFVLALMDLATTLLCMNIPAQFVGMDISYHVVNGMNETLGQPVLKQSVEVNSFFVPFLSVVVLGGAACFIRWLPGSVSVKNGVCCFLVVLLFSASANNICMLLGVQSLSVLG